MRLITWEIRWYVTRLVGGRIQSLGAVQGCILGRIDWGILRSVQRCIRLNQGSVQSLILACGCQTWVFVGHVRCHIRAGVFGGVCLDRLVLLHQGWILTGHYDQVLHLFSLIILNETLILWLVRFVCALVLVVILGLDQVLGQISLLLLCLFVLGQLLGSILRNLISWLLHESLSHPSKEIADELWLFKLRNVFKSATLHLLLEEFVEVHLQESLEHHLFLEFQFIKVVIESQLFQSLVALGIQTVLADALLVKLDGLSAS